MKTIWKFELLPMDEQIFLMPSGAKFLHVDCQRDKLCLWALVNAEKPQEYRHIRIAGTGHPIPDEETAWYIGSVLMMDGQIVWHVFDVTPNRIFK